MASSAARTASVQPPAATAEQTNLVRVDLAGLAECELDPTQYAVERILPRKHVTLLGGHGGSGKSIFAETIAAHVAQGCAWGGLSVTQGRALLVELEDPGELARYRLRRIAGAYGLDPATIAASLLVLDGSNSDSILAAEVNSAGLRFLSFTPVLEEIETAAAGCSLVVIDNASDAFDGDENHRRMVRAFVRRLAQIARRHDCAVLLLVHIDKLAARHGSQGNTYSGSTAWHNTVRSRLALIEDESGPRLMHEKNNLGRRLDPIRLEWSDAGVLMPLLDTGSAAVERDAQDDADVLAAIQAAIRDGATVYAARSGSHSALAILRAYPDLTGTLRKNAARFWAALTRLERASCVIRETFRNENRKEKVRLTVRCASPPYPLATGARVGCATAPLDEKHNRRGTGALAQCSRCGGEGCAWCKPKTKENPEC